MGFRLIHRAVSHAALRPTAEQVQGAWKTFASPSVLFLLISAIDTNLGISQAVIPHLAQSTHTSFPGGSVVENPLANSKDTLSVSGLRRLPGERNGNPLQYSCLWNPMDRRTWRATVQGVRHDLATEFTGAHTYTKTHGRASMVSPFQTWPWEQAGSRRCNQLPLYHCFSSPGSI